MPCELRVFENDVQALAIYQDRFHDVTGLTCIVGID